MADRDRRPRPRRRAAPSPPFPSPLRPDRRARAGRSGRSPSGSAPRASPRRARRAARSSSAAAARREAISPAWAPPTPSATAKSGGSQTNVSSFCGRRRPVSVSALARPVLTPRPCRSVWPMRTTSPAVQQPRRRHPRAVDERPVGRADVLDPEAVGPRLEQRMTRRDEVVAVEPDRVLAAAAEPCRHLQLDGRSPTAGRGCRARACAPREPGRPARTGSAARSPPGR